MGRQTVVMLSQRTLWKVGLTGLVLVAMASVAMAQRAQPFAASEKVVLLQAKRFEGNFKLADGDSSLTVGDESAPWRLHSGGKSYSGTLAPKTDKPNRATLDVDGRTVEGTVAIEGKTLTMEFIDGKTVYRYRIALTGRNDGEVSLTKDGATLVSGTIKRA